MKQIIITIISFLFPSALNAQELSVKSFSLAQSDLSAQTSPKKDNNDVNCALVKVQFVGDIDDIEGNVVKPWVKKGNETWVYMTQRSRQLQIKTKEYLPLMVTFADYSVGSLESNRTYVLTIVASGTASVSQKQTLDIKYSPANAVVLIDNEMVQASNGKATVVLPVGEHSYIITAQGYESEEGSLKLKSTVSGKLNIELTKKNTATIASSVSTTSNSSVNKLEGAREEVQKLNEKAVNGDASAKRKESNSINTTGLNTNSSVLSIPVKGQTIEMVKVDGGTFKMGEGVYSDKLVHEVTVSSFYICKYEVTRALFWKVCRMISSDPGAEDEEPAHEEFMRVQYFIEKLNSLTGRKFRLPTEAEWEFAARGGNKSHGYKYSGSDKIDDIAWYDGNSRKQHVVGKKQPNELGIYDMSGNGKEWCQDWYADYTSNSQYNPIGPATGTEHVLRGGDWLNSEHWCQVGVRNSGDLSYSSQAGFRLVLSE